MGTTQHPVSFWETVCLQQKVRNWFVVDTFGSIDIHILGPGFEVIMNREV